MRCTRIRGALIKNKNSSRRIGSARATARSRRYARLVAVKSLLALSIAAFSAPAPAEQIELPSVPHYILVLQAPPEVLSVPRYIAVDENSGAEPKPLGSRSESTRSSVWRPLISRDDPLIVLNLMLGLVTFVIAGLTVLLWRTTWRRIDFAERASIDLERPYLHVAVTKPGLLVMPGRSAHSRRGVFEVSVFNLGLTPATLTHLEYNLVIVDQGSTADPIDPQNTGGRELPVATMSATNHPYSESTDGFLIRRHK